MEHRGSLVCSQELIVRNYVSGVFVNEET